MRWDGLAEVVDIECHFLDVVEVPETFVNQDEESMGEDTLNNEEWLVSVPALFKPDEAWFRSVFPCQPKLVTNLAEVDATHARNREPHALERSIIKAAFAVEEDLVDCLHANVLARNVVIASGVNVE